MLFKYGIAFTFKNVENDRTIFFSDAYTRDSAFKVLHKKITDEAKMWSTDSNLIMLADLVCMRKVDSRA